MSNKLKNQTSPYLLQHSENPVNWFPWCDEAFEKAKEENKPIFLSIGYSTCHWCHVMAHESFEDKRVADILNENFISIKVDKEERPDVDSIYMSVCQAFTGNGGWPMSVFMTHEQKPFFAGTYFPKTTRYGMVGFIDLLTTIHDKWINDKNSLINSADEVIEYFKNAIHEYSEPAEEEMTEAAITFKKMFDESYGGFGPPPKFPTPHNLMFLMNYFKIHKDYECLKMVEKTLKHLYLGGIFDHVGYGFSRYSTDRYYLVPHFEKMLYDNALLIIAYSIAYELTMNDFYRNVAKKTAFYLLEEMRSPMGGFYCAQDADSDGVEGKFYVFEPEEIIEVFGKKDAVRFNERYDITKQGNFEGKSIPNLLISKNTNNDFEKFLPTLRAYRKKRTSLHLDDKILTSWNALAITAFAKLYQITKDEKYLNVAKDAEDFIEKELCNEDNLFVSYREGKRTGNGYLDDYSFYILSLLALYEATLDTSYIEKADKFCDKVVDSFYDEQNNGFFLYGKDSEQLIFKPKETYDGAIPSGNSVMAYVFTKLYHLTKEEKYSQLAENQLSFMSSKAKNYPAGYCFYLLALSMHVHPPKSIVAVLKDESELDALKEKISSDELLYVLRNPNSSYQLINDKTTFYVCENHMCYPPTNEMHK